MNPIAVRPLFCPPVTSERLETPPAIRWVDTLQPHSTHSTPPEPPRCWVEKRLKSTSHTPTKRASVEIALFRSSSEEEEQSDGCCRVTSGPKYPPKDLFPNLWAQSFDRMDKSKQTCLGVDPTKIGAPRPVPERPKGSRPQAASRCWRSRMPRMVEGHHCPPALVGMPEVCSRSAIATIVMPRLRHEQI